MWRANRGMSYVEVLVAGAILITLAGVVVPTVSIRKMDQRVQQIDQDLNDLRVGVQRFIEDTRTFPTGHDGATSYHFLFTDGIRPDNNLYASGPGMHVEQFLVNEQFAPAGWHGPYLDRRVGPDPWGHAYLINVNGFFSSSERPVVISAGPNGQINTPMSATTASGDDILLPLD